MPRPAFLQDGGCPVVGMVHLPPLPGAPRYGGEPAAIERAALEDVDALLAGGVAAILVENFHDAPFWPGSVPAETVAAMAAVVRRVRSHTDLPLGVNVLRNDGCAALAIAVATGADFVRVNVLTGARLTDQGIVQGVAHELLRARRRLGADRVAILADVAVKHSAPLADVPLDQEVADTIRRGGADALIVTGSGTGAGVALSHLRSVRAAAGDSPVLVGSGVTEADASLLAAEADALIVGTALKRPDDKRGAIDRERVRRLVAHANTPTGAVRAREDA